MESSPVDAPAPQGTYVQPPSSAPTVLGALNIAFGGILLLCGVVTLAQMAIITPLMSPIIHRQQEFIEAAHRAEQQERIARLREQQAQAQTEEERAMLEAQIQAGAGVPKPPDISGVMMMAASPKMVTYQIIDVATAMVLNALLLISGIGLLRMRSWGRSLALWVAGFKILRLIAVQTLFVIVVIPLVLQEIGKLFDQIPVPRGGGPSPRDMLPVMGVFYLIAAVATVLIGSIYPVVLLWLLNTRRVRERFSKENGVISLHS